MNDQTIYSRRVIEMPQNYADTPDCRKQIIAYLIRAGVQAPSWYNCQPWRFDVGEDYINVILDDSRDRSLYDWGHFNSMLACGAAIRNIEIAAQGRGISTRIEWLSEVNGDNLVVATIWLNFSTATYPSEHDLAIEKAIWIRHTNTSMFDNNPLADFELAALTAAIDYQDGVGLQLLTSQKDKENVFRAAARAEQIRFSRKDLHEQLHKMIRWNDKDAYADKTGYTLPSMGVCGFGKAFFWMSKAWCMMRVMNLLGVDRSQAGRACAGLMHCGVIGLLTVRASSSYDLLRAGNALESIWLEMTASGLAVQPHNSILQFYWAWKFGQEDIYNVREREVLNEAFVMLSEVFSSLKLGKDRFGVFLFRVGKGGNVKGFTLREDVARISRKP
ncbi:hypothetical protein [Methylomonas sp. MgM2]